MIPANPPTVSLYIPCHNVENHIKRTLDSVSCQTYPISEIIAVDDGSTDQTSKILESFPIRVISHPGPMGITRTRNTALETVRGEFVASVDADVVLEADWLAKIMAAFSKKSIGGVSGRIIETNTDSLAGQWVVAHRNPDRGEQKKNLPALPTAAVVYRRRVLLEVGGFNDDKRYDHSDLDASMRVVMVGYRLAYEPGALCYHHFQGDVQALFDGLWQFKKDAYINCGLFANHFGLRRKIEINLGEFHQKLMNDFKAQRHAILHLNIIGALRHSLMDLRLFNELHPEIDRKVAMDTFRALKLGLRYLFHRGAQISSHLSSVLLRCIHNIYIDSEREDRSSAFPRKIGEDDLRLLVRDCYPNADLASISDWLIVFLGFLNSFPCDVWETMNRRATEEGSAPGREISI